MVLEICFSRFYLRLHNKSKTKGILESTMRMKKNLWEFLFVRLSRVLGDGSLRGDRGGGGGVVGGRERGKLEVSTSS